MKNNEKETKAVENFRCDSRMTGCGNFVVSSTFTHNGLISSKKVDSASICENAKYSIYDIANWFLMKDNLTHKKLQKLCYYAQAWSYALNNYRLTDSDFQAWIYGPVSPVLYERFSGFGYDTIKASLLNKPIFDAVDETLLNDVWDTYGEKTGNALEALSCLEDPWMEARRGYRDDEKCDVVISTESMRKYYSSICVM